jgi:lysophospholipid acyltransferase (LPLAT)-like uncharacterized protein
MASDCINNLAPALAAGYIRLVGATSHWETEGFEPIAELLRGGRPAIFAFWHNRFILMPYYYRYRLGKERIAVMVSQSRDGGIVEGFLDRYRFRTVRGSSSRGGRRAVISLLRLLKEGWDAAVTPDGPRGPRYRVQDGILTLASVSGLPIVPVSAAASLRCVFRRSWDHFRLPLPASRIRMVFEKPLAVERELTDGDRESCREILRRRLRRADLRAEELAGLLF